MKNFVLAKSGVLFFASWLASYALDLRAVAGTVPEYARAVLVFALAILLFIIPDRFTLWLMRSPAPVPDRDRISVNAFFRVALVSAGILIIGTSLTSFDSLFSAFTSHIRFERLQVRAVLNIAQLAWGIYLAFGAPYLLEWQVTRTTLFVNPSRRIRNGF